MTTDNEIKGILHVPEGSVVVGVDGADPSHAALMWAAAEAARRGLELHIVNVEETLAAWLPLGAALGEVTQTLEASSTALVKAAVETVSGRYPTLVVSTSQPEGQPSRNFIKASEAASLLVLGTHGHHKLSRAALGTTAFKAASHARCPVVLVHPDRKHEHVSPARVVVGVDFSASSQHALDFAALAAGPGGSVRIVHAWWLSSTEGAILGSGDADAERAIIDGHAHDVDQIAEQASARHPEVTFEASPMQGSPVSVLVAAAEDADLLVVSKRGKGGFGGLLLGSTAFKMMAASPVPVALTHTTRTE
ncbi:MAG: universal stress protein [Dermatophilaceae bacterium]